MPILNIQLGSTGLVDVKPRMDYIFTNDSESEILSSGYLNHSVETGFSFNQGDLVCVTTQANPTARLNSGIYQVDHNGANWNLIPTISSPTTSGQLIGIQIFNVVGGATYIPTVGTSHMMIEMCGGGGNGAAGIVIIYEYS